MIAAGIACFLAEPTGWARVYLRRYRASDRPDECRVCGYHNAKVEVDVCRSGGASSHRCEPGDEYFGDARWPDTCACGYAFIDSDPAQVFYQDLYRGEHPVRGTIDFTLEEAPSGAIWRVPWYEQMKEYAGPDGRSYICQTPGGPWHIDGPSSSDGVRWTRTGEPPHFTVTPSIAIPASTHHEAWHGWLKQGTLEAA